MASDQLNSKDISLLLDGELDENKKQKLLSHLKGCQSCREALKKAQQLENALEKNLDRELPDDVPRHLMEKSMLLIKQELKRERLNNLLATLGQCVHSLPEAFNDTYHTIAKQMGNKFRESFASVVPCFPVIFGKSKFTVLKPYGKIRPPIVFEWTEYSESANLLYKLSIEGTNWSESTNKTLVELQPHDAGLEYGKEYMWLLKVYMNSEKLKQINGFFTLITHDENKLVDNLESSINRSIAVEDQSLIMAGFLEELELYIDAINAYKQSYIAYPNPSVAYRIACCYDALELLELRQEWNLKIKS